MIVRLHYADGETENHELKNGVHFADYIRRVDVPAVHLACSPENTNAIAFYQRLGFEDLMAGFLWGRATEPLGQRAVGGHGADGGT